MYGGPIGPGFDVLSLLIPAILIGGVVYLALSLAQRRVSPRPVGAGSLENPVLKTLYTLAVAALVAAFVGFGIEAFYPSPAFPEPDEAMMNPEMYGPEPGAIAGEPGPPPPEFVEAERESQREYEAYERELAAHSGVASAVAIGAAVLILVLGLVPRIGRLPSIGDGLILGGVFTLLYGTVLALQSQSEVARFVAVAVGLVVLLAALYLKSRSDTPTAAT